MNNAELTAAEYKFIHDYSRLLSQWNMPIMAARVYCYLQIVMNPSPLDEIAVAMNTTKGNISSAATLLESQGSAIRITERGNRRVLYVASECLAGPFRKHVDLLDKMASVAAKGSEVISSGTGLLRLDRLREFNVELGNMMNDVISRTRWRRTP